jgi:hypothetical protein
MISLQTMAQAPLDLDITDPKVKSGIQDYIDKLEAHDWYHEFSDDARAYTRGKQQRRELDSLRQHIDPDYGIWNKHCQPGCQNGGYGL